MTVQQTAAIDVPQYGSRSPCGCGELNLPVNQRAGIRGVAANKARSIRTIGSVYRIEFCSILPTELPVTQRSSTHAAFPASTEARPSDLPPRTRRPGTAQASRLVSQLDTTGKRFEKSYSLAS